MPVELWTDMCDVANVPIYIYPITTSFNLHVCFEFCGVGIYRIYGMFLKG